MRSTTPAEAPTQPSNGRAFESQLSEQELSVLLKELNGDAARIVKKEYELASAELKEAVTSAKHGIIGLLTAAAALLVGVSLLLIAFGLGASTGLQALGMPPQFANILGFVIVGAVLLLTAFVLSKYNIKKLSPRAFKPTRTLESLQNTYRWAKSKIQ